MTETEKGKQMENKNGKQMEEISSQRKLEAWRKNGTLIRKDRKDIFAVGLRKCQRAP